MTTTDEILANADTVGPPLGSDEYDPIWDEIQRDFYDREGRPISMRDWSRLRQWDLQNEGKYKRIASDHVGPYFVSTVWLGLDHGFGGPAPLIFETMVFKDEDWEDLDMERYSTEEEALAGHKKILDRVALIYNATREIQNE